jgi:2-oxoglutarate ferredoxin oxidoreductase subunit delta
MKSDTKGKSTVRVTLIPQSCKGVEECGICIFVCPKKLFISSQSQNEVGYIPPEIPDQSECTGCENCMRYCPDFAIFVSRPSTDTKK